MGRNVSIGATRGLVNMRHRDYLRFTRSSNKVGCRFRDMNPVALSIAFHSGGSIDSLYNAEYEVNEHHIHFHVFIVERS
jgi:hypothetical protein